MIIFGNIYIYTYLYVYIENYVINIFQYSRIAQELLKQ